MQPKRKILFFITKGNFGGAQRYVYDLATRISKYDLEAVVACGQGDLLIERLKEARLNDKVGQAKIKTIKIENLGREIKIKNDFKVFRNLVKIIKDEKPDVIHLNSSKIGFLGSLAVLYFRIPYFLTRNSFPVPRSIFTAHGWAFNEMGRPFFSKLLYYAAYYLTVLVCDITIAVSEKAKRDISCLPFTENKVRVVYNGIEKFNPSADGLSKAESRIILTGKDSDKTVIFSISELHNNKGIDVALRALSLLPKEIKEKIIYSIAGDGEEKEKLEKLAKELHIENLVKFMGFVPDAKKLLLGSDIFLLPSRTEALPYVLLEAGMAGLPIIATCTGGIPEIVRDMQNGILVHRANPKEIAEAVLYLLDRPSKRKEFGNEINKTVINFFSIEKMLEETVKLYR